MGKKIQRILNILKRMLIDIRFERKRHHSMLPIGSKGKDNLSKIYDEEEEALNYVIEILEKQGDKTEE